MNWNRKSYAIELKKNYWVLEPHFFHYSLMDTFSLFETFMIEKMTSEDIRSALYGKFVSDNKPILTGFYETFNLIYKIIEKISKKEIDK